MPRGCPSNDCAILPRILVHRKFCRCFQFVAWPRPLRYIFNTAIQDSKCSTAPLNLLVIDVHSQNQPRPCWDVTVYGRSFLLIEAHMATIHRKAHGLDFLLFFYFFFFVNQKSANVSMAPNDRDILRCCNNGRPSFYCACKPAAATSTCDPIAVDSDDVAFTVEQPTCFRVVSN